MHNAVLVSTPHTPIGKATLSRAARAGSEVEEVVFASVVANVPQVCLK